MAEPAERKSVTMTVTSRSEEDLATWIQMCKTVASMCAVGASRVVRISVDGDGAADLRFDFGETDVLQVEVPDGGRFSKEEYGFGIGY